MPKLQVNLANLVFLDRALDFIEAYDFPRDLLIDVVRAPEHTEMDPSAGAKGYPVVRFRRGDITVVMGVQNPENPSIIHVHLHTPDEDNGSHQGTKKTGGATGSKIPGSDVQLRGWLQSQGCRLTRNGRGHYNVEYDGVLLGGIRGTGHASGTAIKNDYMFMRKRLASVKAQQYIRDTKKEE